MLDANEARIANITLPEKKSKNKDSKAAREKGLREQDMLQQDPESDADTDGGLKPAQPDETSTERQRDSHQKKKLLQEYASMATSDQ